MGTRYLEIVEVNGGSEQRKRIECNLTAADFAALTPLTPATLSAAGGLINTTGIALLSSTTVNTNVGTKQALYTVPAAKACVITQMVLRGASASLAAMGDDTGFGFDSPPANTVLLDSAQLALLTTASRYILPNLSEDVPTFGNFRTLGNAGEVFGVIFYDTSIVATVKIDVFGYLIDV